MTEPSQAEKTIHTVIGPGVVLHGTLKSVTGNSASRIIVMGEVHGDIFTDGILEISEGAVLNPIAVVECFEMVVAGKVSGESVIIRTELFNLLTTGRVDIDTLCLPPGGLEQLRGSVLNARLDMSPNARLSVAKAPMGPPDALKPPSSVDPVAPPGTLVGVADHRVHLPANQPAPAPNSKTDFSDPSKLAGSLPTFGRSRSDSLYAGVVLPDEIDLPPQRVNVELVDDDDEDEEEDSKRDLANKLAAAEENARKEHARNEYARKIAMKEQKRLEGLKLSDQQPMSSPSVKFMAPSVSD